MWDSPLASFQGVPETAVRGVRDAILFYLVHRNQHHNSDINNIFQLPHLGASHICWLDWRALGPALDSVLRVRQQLLHNPHLASLLSLERHFSSQQPFFVVLFFVQHDCGDSSDVLFWGLAIQLMYLLLLQIGTSRSVVSSIRPYVQNNGDFIYLLLSAECFSIAGG